MNECNCYKRSSLLRRCSARGKEAVLGPSALPSLGDLQDQRSASTCAGAAAREGPEVDSARDQCNKDCEEVRK